MVYIVEISVSDLGRNYDYKSKVWYSHITSLKSILDCMETLFYSKNVKYSVPIHMYEYIVSEDLNIGPNSFSITVLLYDIGPKGFLFVQVKKRLLHHLVEVV